MAKDKPKKAKKTCRCKCGRMYRPERLSRMKRNPNGKIDIIKVKKPECIGFCSKCYDKILEAIGFRDFKSTRV